MPSGCDPMGGNGFSEKIMLKQRDEIMIRSNLIDRNLVSVSEVRSMLQA
jgi:hypothetical protein